MTDTGRRGISSSERLIVSLILAAVALLTLVDIAIDWRSGSSLSHIAVELLTAGGAIVGLGWLWTGYFRLRRRLSEARSSLADACAEAALWRQRHGERVRGLSEAIDQQLEAWALTPAEKEISFLLLKGLSFKEIAGVRAASERTVRQQALAVYAKSGLAGRAELAAFFLEDLLVPPAAEQG